MPERASAFAGNFRRPGAHLERRCQSPSAEEFPRETEMTLCPVALAVGCRKCPVFNVCPAKGFIGDYKEDKKGPTSRDKKPPAGTSKARRNT
jgi:hypothetical protein